MEVYLQYDNEKTSLMFNKQKMDRDGELLAKHRKEYPTYHALHKYFDGDKSDKLESEDGVTSYSRAYWKGKQKKGGKLKLAIDETLAEVSYLRIQGKGENVSGTWTSFKDAVNVHYSRIKKKR